MAALPRQVNLRSVQQTSASFIEEKRCKDF